MTCCCFTFDKDAKGKTEAFWYMRLESFTLFREFHFENTLVILSYESVSLSVCAVLVAFTWF